MIKISLKRLSDVITFMKIRNYSDLSLQLYYRDSNFTLAIRTARYNETSIEKFLNLLKLEFIKTIDKEHNEFCEYILYIDEYELNSNISL